MLHGFRHFRAYVGDSTSYVTLSAGRAAGARGALCSSCPWLGGSLALGGGWGGKLGGAVAAVLRCALGRGPCAASHRNSYLYRGVIRVFVIVTLGLELHGGADARLKVEHAMAPAVGHKERLSRLLDTL